MFVGEARSVPYNGAPVRCFTFVNYGRQSFLIRGPDLTNITAGKKLLKTNTLAYFSASSVTRKIVITMTLGACTIKLFTTVIYGNKIECLSLSSLFSLV
jgi:hypothetical protein